MEEVCGDVLLGIVPYDAVGRRDEGVREEREKVPAVVSRVPVCEGVASVAVVAATNVCGHHARKRACTFATSCAWLEEVFVVFDGGADDGGGAEEAGGGGVAEAFPEG